MPLTVRRTAPLAAVACLLLSAGAAVAQDPANDAIFVTVPNPLTSAAVTRIKNQVDARIHTPIESRKVQTIVFDFNPDAKPASTADFGPCFDLADYISKPELKGKTTIAFVHAQTTGHTVLPVLACKEVVMSAKTGVLGPVVVDKAFPKPDEVRKLAYKKVFNRDDRWPIVQKMFDDSVDLQKGFARVSGAPMFINAADPAQAALVVGAQPVVGVQPGAYASYPAKEARDVELAKGLADTRMVVAELYGLPPSSVHDDPLGGRTPDAFQWTLKGDVDGAMKESVNRIIRDVRKRKGNVLILVLQCGGTDLEAARGLADDLVKAQSPDDENRLLIIGFIPESAPDAATVIALGCTEIVMTKPKGDDGKEAEIGNFERFIKGSRPDKVDSWRKSLRDFAKQRGYSELLIEGMFNRDVEIVRARGVDNRNQTKLFTREELAIPDNAKAWKEDKVIKAPGSALKLNATLAAELGLARFTVPTTNVSDVCSVYGVGDAKSPDPGWLDQFAAFLRIPAVTIILVMLGFIGLILELKVPGLTVPGIIAALCFILVFWSQSRFSGEMFVLALLLFILGLVLVGIEIFVLPDFGACGIFGILCMLAGLGLVTLDKVPENTSDWVGFGVKVSTYLFAMMGAMFFAFLIAKFLPQVPGANRLMLTPPTDQPLASQSQLPGASEAAELLGAVGTATTALRPAGVVRFGDKFVDVVSDGGFIPAGSRVNVIAVEGTRIVVKEV